MKYYFTISVKYYSILGFKGIISLIRSKFSNGNTLHEVKRKELKAPIFLRVHSTDIDAYDDVFLKNEYKIHFIKKPEVIIDAGGNIGLTAIYFANQFPDAKIYSIEPEKSNFELLKKNTVFYRQIIPVQAALWFENKEVNVVDTGKGSWAFKTTNNSGSMHKPETFVQSVRAVTIGKIMADFGLEKIDLLKMDIEGAEKEIFEHSSRWIHNINCLIVELHEQMKPGCLRSFYNGTNGFDSEWQKGYLFFLSREGCCQKS